MTTNAKTYYAGLIFCDDNDLTAKRLLTTARHAMRQFGARDVDVSELTFDSLVLSSRDVSLDIRFVDAPEVDAFAAKSDTPSETFTVEITLQNHATLPGAHDRTGEALLATIVQSFVELTGAPMIQWQSRETILSAARFQAAMTSIRAEPEQAKDDANVETSPQAATLVASPRRVRPSTTHRARCGTALAGGMAAMDLTTPLDAPSAPCVINAQADFESLEDVFRVDVDLPEGAVIEMEGRNASLERRVATWTVTASVAVFAPPVGAAMMTYNMIKGENFRLTAQALTLTGAFMGLGLTEAMAATVAILPF